MVFLTMGSRVESVETAPRVEPGLCAPFNSTYSFDIPGEPRSLVPVTSLLFEKVRGTDRIAVDIHQFAARFFAQAKARLFGLGSVGLDAMCGGLQINQNLRQAGAVRRLEPYDRCGRHPSNCCGRDKKPRQYLPAAHSCPRRS
jgi:hypothetical protein